MSFNDLERGYGSGYQQPTPYQPAGRGGDQEYVQLSDRVTQSIQQIAENVTSISKTVSLLGTPKDTIDVRERLHDQTEETKEMIKEVNKDIKLLGKMDGGSPTENRSRRLQQQKLSSNLREVLDRFTQIQRLAQQKEREYVTNAKKAQTSKQEILSRTEEDETEENKNLIQDELKRQQLMALENEIEYNQAIITEREEGIKDIENSIREIRDIFMDLGTIVNEQQSLVDNIESNVEAVVENTSSATGEIKKASDYQKSARTKMCCILMIFLIIIAIIIIIVVLKLA